MHQISLGLNYSDKDFPPLTSHAKVNTNQNLLPPPVNSATRNEDPLNQILGAIENLHKDNLSIKEEMKFIKLNYENALSKDNENVFKPSTHFSTNPFIPTLNQQPAYGQINRGPLYASKNLQSQRYPQ